MSSSSYNGCQNGVSNDDDSHSTSNSNSKLNQSDNLSIFCREVRNLLRSKPNCMIPFSKFVPAYHNHYGRQCCVYQFGYTKLIELLESIPHVVQILGDGTNRYITLTHREQIKRFASDLIKVVKSQPGKKLKLSQFAQAYEQVLGRTFNVEDYGTNNINVLLAEIWEGTINIMPIRRELVDKFIKGPLFVATDGDTNNNNDYNSTNNNNDNNMDSLMKFMGSTSTNKSLSASSSSNSICGTSSSQRSRENSILNQLVASCQLTNKPYITEQYPDAWFEIPKRERSDKEIKRTKYFVWDVIELLSNMKPSFSVTFSKFIPSYHYYFNRQCKVSIFGFSKLIDLFESISPQVVEIVDQGPGKEKIIKLADKYIPKNRYQNQRHHHSHHHHNKGNYSSYKISYSDSYKRQPQEEEEEANMVADDDVGDDDGIGEEDDDVEQFEEADYEDQYDDEDDMEGDDIVLPARAIDTGPTEDELREIEEELEAYEAAQSKRSSRMAAILDIFKYSIY